MTSQKTATEKTSCQGEKRIVVLALVLESLLKTRL